MKRLFVFLLLTLNLLPEWNAQVGISQWGTPPNDRAGLDIDYSDKGFLPPRLTSAQRDMISSPVPSGLIIFNTTIGCPEYYQAGHWYSLCGTCPPPAGPAQGSHSTTDAQIQWSWLPSDDADGYRYSTTNQYNSATDAGTSTTWLQQGLACGENHQLYVWSYSVCGVSEATILNASTTACPCSIAIGDTGPGGGKVFYVDQFSCTALESITSDLGGLHRWGCYLTLLNVGGSAIGTGAANTQTIVGSCGESNVAAKLCDNLVSGGKSDWFLPSRDELAQMYVNRLVIGGTWYDYGHWSSTEWLAAQPSGHSAYMQQWNTGSQSTLNKTTDLAVRCIRVY